jgi:hypothetical protein
MLGLFGKNKVAISAREFERELSSLIVRGRLANVNKSVMMRALRSSADGLQREINRAIEDRNMRLTPRVHSGTL